METWKLLLDLVTLLAACIIVGGIFARFGQSPMVGYLLAGMITGGNGSLHIIHQEHTIEQIAELGVALLLFSLGLEFSFSRLRALGTRTLISGGLQVVVTTGVAALLAMPFTSNYKEAVAIGAMVSLSSTACVLRVLMDRSEVETPHGRNTLAILLVQDIAVVPLVILMTLLAQGGTTLDIAKDVGAVLMMSLGLVASLYVVLNFIAIPVFGTMTLERNRELTMVLAVVIGLGSASIAALAGVSASLGAFIAGMFLGSSRFSSQIRADVSSLRTVLLTLFFGAAGMLGDPIWLLKNLPLVALVTTAIILVKMGVVWGILRQLGQSTHVAAATGVCLAQIGEFAFVLGSIAHDKKVITTEIHELMVSATIATLFVSPYLVPNAIRIGSWLSRRKWAPNSGGSKDQDHAPDIIFIGFGPSGQAAAEPFLGRSDNVHVVDLSRRCLARATEMGFVAHHGDGGHPEILEHVHVASARAVVITVPDHQGALRILDEVRRLAPHAHTIVRSRHQRFSQEYDSAGANIVLGDEEEVGKALGQEVERWLKESEELGMPHAAPAPEEVSAAAKNEAAHL